MIGLCKIQNLAEENSRGMFVEKLIPFRYTGMSWMKDSSTPGCQPLAVFGSTAGRPEEYK